MTIVETGDDGQLTQVDELKDRVGKGRDMEGARAVLLEHLLRVSDPVLHRGIPRIEEVNRLGQALLLLADDKVVDREVKVDVGGHRHSPMD